MPFLLNYQEFCEELPEITTLKIVDKRKFHAEGLFSEQIFGPVKNYTCQCGTYYGISGSGGTCNDCGVDVVNSDERRRRFAKITLPIKVINPLFLDLLTELGGNAIRDIFNQLMTNEQSAVYWDEVEEEFVLTSLDSPALEDKAVFTAVEAIYEITKDLCTKMIEQGDIEWKLVEDNLDQLAVDQVIVLPADLRPASSRMSQNEQVIDADKINRFYKQILTKKQVMEDSIVDIRKDNNLHFNYFRQLQKDINELYVYILEKLSKKEGLIRGNILGKRIDFSGRAVITPDPTLNMDECYLPYIMFLELFKLQIAKKLIQLNKFKLLNDAIDFIDDCYEYNNPVLFKICEELAEGEVCILNRQPSLHKLSMLGYKVKVCLGSVIKIHPLSCPPFNADFDGDQMAVYIPISPATKQEVLDKLLVTKNLNNPSNGTLSTTPSQDIVLGIYAITNHLLPDLQKVKFTTEDGTEITEDMALFNDCLPEDHPVINEPMDSKKLNSLLNSVNEKYDSDVASETLDKIKFLGFKYSTLFGATMSLDDVYIPEANNKRDELFAESDDIMHQLNAVSSHETQEFLEDNFSYAYMVTSGARGSWDQVRQIVLTRGFISNFNGEIIPEPIKSSFLNGLTPREFFNSTYGSRKGLLDVALNTGTSGYLSRKLIFACANLQLDEELDDCGTEDLLQVYVNDLKKARMMVGKWFQKEDKSLGLITKTNYTEFVEKTIHVRSPIFCTSPKICKRCYGELYNITKSEFIGVLAAQSLGECNTQLILRTFHTSGVAVVKENTDKEDTSQDMKQQDIVADLSTVSKLLHRFEKNTTPTDLVSKLFTSYNTSRTIHHAHFECVVSQLMWYDIYKWRLLKNRDEMPPQYNSVQTVPSYESWLLGLAFSNPKKHIIKGILHPGIYKGVMDKILCGEKM